MRVPTAPIVQRYVALLALIFAGEVVFSLPFHIPRFFRPTLLDVFQLSNTQLGDIFALYGVVAMLAYLPGGAIADRFAARSLMVASLIATALGGIYLYTLPGLTGLYLLFAYWGLTSILLFWAALIKATRDWGGQHTQGRAFGLLDGGRGLVASVFATVALFMLSGQSAGADSNQAALQSVILFYSGATFLAAVVIWFVLPKTESGAHYRSHTGRPDWRLVLSIPSVWLQAVVVICAYSSFKALDNYGVYAVQVLEFSQVEAAQLNTYSSYIRPLAAIAAGFWADHWRTSKLVTLLFACAGAAFVVLGQGVPESTAVNLLLVNVVVTFVAVYALRGIYFSMIEEARLDMRITGSAVGLISVLGFTPDIFFGAVTGRILDANPGAVGFQHYFLFMAAICAAGMLCTLVFTWYLRFSKSR